MRQPAPVYSPVWAIPVEAEDARVKSCPIGQHLRPPSIRDWTEIVWDSGKDETAMRRFLVQ